MKGWQQSCCEPKFLILHFVQVRRLPRSLRHQSLLVSKNFRPVNTVMMEGLAFISFPVMVAFGTFTLRSKYTCVSREPLFSCSSSSIEEPSPSRMLFHYYETRILKMATLSQMRLRSEYWDSSHDT
mmetsp:Transcript_37804/g.61467  ORF Transcript_37804/g.61467 Transcript_37804/m.61467 type:complete len:126 (-) Transcript_37804:1017-1394(-)